MATIAIIDDEQFVQDVLGEILQIAGHDVLRFADGAPFLETVDFEKIDLVIADLVMPTGGEEIVAAMAAKDIQVPVIVIAGYMPNKTACTLLATGAHDVLQKPIPITEFLEVTHKWLGIAAYQ